MPSLLYIVCRIGLGSALGRCWVGVSLDMSESALDLFEVGIGYVTGRSCFAQRQLACFHTSKSVVEVFTISRCVCVCVCLFGSSHAGLNRGPFGFKPHPLTNRAIHR